MKVSVNSTDSSVRVFSCMQQKCDRISFLVVFKYAGSVSDSTDYTVFLGAGKDEI